MDYASLKAVYAKLIDNSYIEQVYQDFLEEYPEFIPREFVQHHGVHAGLVLRKVRFGNELVSDFVYLSKSSGDWNVVLVELEKPQSKYFKDDRGTLHPDFLKGLHQIGQWRAWFQSTQNKAYFVDTTLGFLRVPLRMRSNPCHMKFVLVTGRAAESRENELKRGIVTANEQADFKILSYDSLLYLERNPSPNYVGILRAGAVDIVSRRYSGDAIFSMQEPEKVRITSDLRADCLAHKADWRTRSIEDDGTVTLEGSGKMILDEKLDKFGTCDRPNRKELIAAAAKLGLALP